MKFLADEGVDRQIVDMLRAAGHTVQYVAEMESGIADDLVLNRANEQGALLITEDKDFGELVFRQALVHHGVTLVRLHGLSSEAKAQIVADAIAQHGSELPSA